MTRRWVGAAVVGAMLVFTAVVYGRLPERIPTHWNFAGEVDGWSGRLVGSVLLPLISLAVWALLPLLRRIDPRRNNYARFDETFFLVINLVVMLLAGIHVMSLGTALGWRIDMTRALLVILGVVFVVLGNYLPRIRSNWWMGIRTPWTMESETVWRETHRVAGYTFVAGGLIAALSGLLPAPVSFGVGMSAVMVAAMVPVVYSFVVYRRERSAAAGQR